MEQTFYQFGVLYLRWEKEGSIYEAVKEQVDWFGKAFFEQDLEEFCNENDLAKPDRITFADDWYKEEMEHLRWCEEHKEELDLPF